jgi:hypothetical protein
LKLPFQKSVCPSRSHLRSAATSVEAQELTILLPRYGPSAALPLPFVGHENQPLRCDERFFGDTIRHFLGEFHVKPENRMKRGRSVV